MGSQITEQILSDRLSQQPRWIGESLRFETCPHCGQSHQENPAVAVDLSKQSYFTHCCGKGGHLNKLISQPIHSMEVKDEPQEQKEKSAFARSIYLDCFSRASKYSSTAHYLRTRHIKFFVWKDLDYPLKESIIQRDGNQKVAVYPFLNSKGEIVASQSVVFNPNEDIKISRRYQGPKSLGVGLLKKSDKMIVAEGLENGLSVRQFLGREYGLIICGDAGNLAKLSSEHSWALIGCKEIVVAVDNDANLVGLNAAKKILWQNPHKTILKMPSATGQDWNDVLIAHRISEEWI